jgi:membrane glycosyltransferase
VLAAFAAVVAAFAAALAGLFVLLAAGASPPQAKPNEATAKRAESANVLFIKINLLSSQR